MFIAPKFPSCTASYGGADRPMNLCTTECPLLRTSRGGEDLRAINILPLRGKEVLRISEHCHREVTKTAE